MVKFVLKNKNSFIANGRIVMLKFGNPPVFCGILRIEEVWKCCVMIWPHNA